MKKFISVFILLILLLFTSTILINNASAADQYTCDNGPTTYNSYSDCHDSGCSNCILKLTNSPSNTVPLTNPINIPDENKSNPIPYLLGNIIKAALGIIGSLALVMFIYGGATWMLSGGNQERVTKGKNILTWAAAGLVVIFTAYALVKFVITAVTGTGG